MRARNLVADRDGDARCWYAPVVAYASGALPDIVEHGRSGFLVEDVEGMAATIKRCARIDPVACRTMARTRFSAARMVEQYLALYTRFARDTNRLRVAAESARGA